jgi:hypothetical protein
MADADPAGRLTASSDRYMSLRALGAYSGLSVRTLRGHLSDPVRPLPHYRVRGKILIRVREFDGWIQQFRVVRPASTIEAIVDDVVALLR